MLNGAYDKFTQGVHDPMYPARGVRALDGPTDIGVYAIARRSLWGIPPIGSIFFPRVGEPTW